MESGSSFQSTLDSTGAASTFSASIVKTTYGVDVAPDNDKNVALMEKVLQSVQAFAPGRFLVQYFPVLGHVPTWFPVATARAGTMARSRSSSCVECAGLLDRRTASGFIAGSTVSDQTMRSIGSFDSNQTYAVHA